MSTRIAAARHPMRKEPRQARSRATVAAIAEAGARILGAEGWAGFTTNKVAVAAGVSIGSLYQYFPDKHSLVHAIRARHLDDVLAAVTRSTDGGKPLKPFAADLVRGIVDAHSINPRLHRVLLDEVPAEYGSRAAQDDFEARYLGLYRMAVAHYRPAGRSGETELVAQVLSSAVEGVVHNAARRGMLASAEMQRELVDLICAYLSNGPAGS